MRWIGHSVYILKTVYLDSAVVECTHCWYQLCWRRRVHDCAVLHRNHHSLGKAECNSVWMNSSEHNPCDWYGTLSMKYDKDLGPYQGPYIKNIIVLLFQPINCFDQNESVPCFIHSFPECNRCIIPTKVLQVFSPDVKQLWQRWSASLLWGGLLLISIKEPLLKWPKVYQSYSTYTQSRS